MDRERNGIHVVGMRCWKGYLDKGIGLVLHPHLLGLGMAHSKASAGFPVLLPSGVTLDVASVALRQKWQAEAVRAGVLRNRQR